MDAGIYTIPPGLEIAAAHSVVARGNFYRCRGVPVENDDLNYEPTEALVFLTGIIDKWLVIGQTKITGTLGPGLNPLTFLNEINWRWWKCDGWFPHPETSEPVYFEFKTVDLDNLGNTTVTEAIAPCLPLGQPIILAE